MSKPSPFCSWVGLISHKQRCVFNLDKVAFLALVAFQLCVFSHPGTACRHVYSSHHWPLRWPSTNNDRDGPLLSAWNSSFHTQTHGGFQSNGGTPNYPNHLAILVLKPMVTWGSRSFKKPTHTYIHIYIHTYIHSHPHIYYKCIYIYTYTYINIQLYQVCFHTAIRWTVAPFIFLGQSLHGILKQLAGVASRERCRWRWRSCLLICRYAEKWG